ncbi:hypothetical protein IJ384_01250 [bacterium]|nr:hypothetical protein [bacterium]
MSLDSISWGGKASHVGSSTDMNDKQPVEQKSLKTKLWETDVFSYAKNCQSSGAFIG